MHSGAFIKVSESMSTTLLLLPFYVHYTGLERPQSTPRSPHAPTRCAQLATQVSCRAMTMPSQRRPLPSVACRHAQPAAAKEPI